MNKWFFNIILIKICTIINLQQQKTDSISHKVALYLGEQLLWFEREKLHIHSSVDLLVPSWWQCFGSGGNFKRGCIAGRGSSQGTYPQGDIWSWFIPSFSLLPVCPGISSLCHMLPLPRHSQKWLIRELWTEHKISSCPPKFLIWAFYHHNKI